jgi:glycerate 2-kinase
VRIVVAPDSFKGSLSAVRVADAMARGIAKALQTAEIIKVPMADGGEGLVEALVTAAGGEIKPVNVTGPLGEPVESFFGVLADGKTAVIEMASASGLTLVPLQKRNPLLTTTYGTGELIKAALNSGCSRLIIGIGGSATNDGGMGWPRHWVSGFMTAQTVNWDMAENSWIKSMSLTQAAWTRDLKAPK